MIFANKLLKKPKNLAFEYWNTELLQELEEMMFGKIQKGRAPKVVKMEEEKKDDEEIEEEEEEEKKG